MRIAVWTVPLAAAPPSPSTEIVYPPPGLHRMAHKKTFGKRASFISLVICIHQSPDFCVCTISLTDDGRRRGRGAPRAAAGAARAARRGPRPGARSGAPPLQRASCMRQPAAASLEPTITRNTHRNTARAVTITRRGGRGGTHTGQRPRDMHPTVCAL